MNRDYMICESGSMQSPIDIKNTRYSSELRTFLINYKKSIFNISHQHNRVRLHVETANTTKVNLTTYQLEYIDLHFPSEHTIAGNPHSFEMQFFHISKDRRQRLAIVLFLEESRANNQLLQPLVEHLLRLKKKKEGVLQLNISKILPERPSHYYSYQGSLTRPPCTENIRWLLLRDTKVIGKDQIDTFQKFFQNNVRPAQLIEKRVIHSNH